MDIHSAAGEILYNWGDDDNQSHDPGMSFLDPRWDGRARRRQYRRLPRVDHRGATVRPPEASPAGSRPRCGRSAGDRSMPVQAVGLFPTSGASDDYAFSRFQAKPELNKTYGYTMEFGYPTNFYPTITEFHQNLLDVGAGLMEFCLAAAAVGLD